MKKIFEKGPRGQRFVNQVEHRDKKANLQAVLLLTVFNIDRFQNYSTIRCPLEYIRFPWGSQGD